MTISCSLTTSSHVSERPLDHDGAVVRSLRAVIVETDITWMESFDHPVWVMRAPFHARTTRATKKGLEMEWKGHSINNVLSRMAGTMLKDPSGRVHDE